MRKTPLSLALLSTLTLAPLGIAQAALYDAGFTGVPPVPTSPLLQGWSLRNAGGVVHGAVVGNMGLNAWEVSDSSGPGAYDFAYFHQVPSGVTLLDFVGGAWELTATVNLIGGADAATFIEVSTGITFLDTAYRIFLKKVGNDAQIFNGYGGLLFQCPNGADGNYHHFSLRKLDTVLYNPVQVLFDGAVLGMIGEDFPGQYGIDDGVKFGTWTDFGASRARFHRVELRSLSDFGAPVCQQSTPNSSGSVGLLGGFGSPYADQNFLRLNASALPPRTFTLFLTSRTLTLTPNPAGSLGDLCLGGVLGRYDRPGQLQMTDAQGRAALQLDLERTPQGSVFVFAYPGDTWYFQAWHRDANPGPTSNFTDTFGVRIR